MPDFTDPKVRSWFYTTSPKVKYLGGHPELGKAMELAVMGDGDNIQLFTHDFNISIPKKDIVSLTCQTIRGRSAGKAAAGALLGGILTGGIGLIAGAIIGGSVNVENVIVLTIKCGFASVDVLFDGGPNQKDYQAMVNALR
ncbi:hypothetical protein H1S01_03450 [Heliobacterium chlorum]|uniref:Uncharacterized protein n=1 Tax=Heliobacterium chlorum TaxID=2698 RepID=A0ABR7SYG0_HELCL|nr:hypothetical protein [Heliobacterium chlorum]MBC9783568.1 hypothetical protein [Heliobacterium chlorum]